MSGLTHIGPDGRARMVDVTDKAVTSRRATASGTIRMSQEAFDLASTNPKGNPVAIAELAGIMGAKQTAALIPLCHPLPLSKVHLEITPLTEAIGFHVLADVSTSGRTGVEMEALTAVSAACLTLYDMLKASDKSMRITDIQLETKSGGKSKDYIR